jgi:hypothetical protein
MRVRASEPKSAGLIRPPRHLVEEVTERLQAKFASYWVNKQNLLEESSFLNKDLISDLNESFEDLEDASDSLRRDNGVRYIRLLDRAELFLDELTSSWRGGLKQPSSLNRVKAKIRDLKSLSYSDSPRDFRRSVGDLEGDFFSLMSDLKSLYKGRTPFISASARPLYERLAKIQDSIKTNVLHTEELGDLTLVGKVEQGSKSSEKSPAYYKLYDPSQDSISLSREKKHIIGVVMFSEERNLGVEELREIEDFARHELVHAFQRQMALNAGVSEAGLPTSSRDRTFRQHDREKEKTLRNQYRSEGLDPSLISIHALDDIEFYSRLLDEVTNFRERNPQPKNSDIRSYLNHRKFFQSLKRYKPRNWKKAVGIFVNEVV